MTEEEKKEMLYIKKRGMLTFIFLAVCALAFLIVSLIK